MISILNFFGLMPLAINKKRIIIKPKKGFVNDFAVGKDGVVWFTLPEASAIASFSEIDGLNIYKKGLSKWSKPNCIEIDCNGNVWFTDPGINAIGHVDPDKSIKFFHKDIDPHAGLGGIASSKNGRIYFTQRSTNKVAEINCYGIVSEWSILNGSVTGLNDGIIVDNSGNIWFSEEFNDSVGFVSRDGKISRFGHGIRKGAAPTDLYLGLDGKIWFCDSFSQIIYNVDTSGLINNFSFENNKLFWPSGVAHLRNDLVLVGDLNSDNLYYFNPLSKNLKLHRIKNMKKSSIWKLALSRDGEIYYLDARNQEISKIATDLRIG